MTTHPGAQYLAELEASAKMVTHWVGLYAREALAIVEYVAAEKARADAAEAAYRLERDQVVAALRAIESMCPATQEMTLAHAMADLARDTLTDIGAE